MDVQMQISRVRSLQDDPTKANEALAKAAVALTKVLDDATPRASDGPVGSHVVTLDRSKYQSLDSWYAINDPAYLDFLSMSGQDLEDETLWMNMIENQHNFAPVYDDMGRRVYHPYLFEALRRRSTLE